MQNKYTYFRLFDLGGYLDVEKVQRALKRTFALPSISATKGAPESIASRSVMALQLEKTYTFTFENGIPCQVSAKIFAVGCISIQFTASFACESLRDLQNYWTLRLHQDGELQSKSTIAQQLFQQIQEQLLDFLMDRYEAGLTSEAYTLFSIQTMEPVIEDFVAKQRNHLAALLLNEENPTKLAPQEIEEVLGTSFSYSHDEVALIGWEAAAVITTQLSADDDMLLVLELAVMQLEELRTYDTYLDRVIEKSVVDVRNIFAPWGFFKGSARRMVEELAETQAELQKMVDQIQNEAKFFGDWYFARVYMGCRKKLHIERWLQSVQGKLQTVGELYILASNEVTNRRLLLLEALIVILIVFEIWLLY